MNEKPPTPSSASSDQVDDALIIAASIGGTLSVLCDSISILAPLKLVGVGLCEVCSTVQVSQIVSSYLWLYLQMSFTDPSE